jgi:hypothetical protein
MRFLFRIASKRRVWAIAGAIALIAAGSAAVSSKLAGPAMTEAAQDFLNSLADQQRAKATMAFDNRQRTAWHFIPLPMRKGLQIKEMNDAQRQKARALLAAALSEVGYEKATKIMELEAILQVLERDRQGGPIRDPERYYFTIFGQPADQTRWGLSVEGHHLSLNFVVDKGRVIAHTPAFFGANPATVRSDLPVGPKKGTRILAKEEQLAFDLVHSLDDAQRAVAVIATKAPPELRAAGEPQPPQTAPEGIAAANLNEAQQATLRALIQAYADNMPEEVAQTRLADLEKAGIAKVYFAWAGATEPGIGHYYRVQGPTFLIEFVNTQPDSAGNPANHIHSVWRDLAGDFGIPLNGQSR